MLNKGWIGLLAVSVTLVACQQASYSHSPQQSSVNVASGPQPRPGGPPVIYPQPHPLPPTYYPPGPTPYYPPPTYYPPVPPPYYPPPTYYPPSYPPPIPNYPVPPPPFYPPPGLPPSYPVPPPMQPPGGPGGPPSIPPSPPLTPMPPSYPTPVNPPSAPPPPYYPPSAPPSAPPPAYYPPSNPPVYPSTPPGPPLPPPGPPSPPPVNNPPPPPIGNPTGQPPPPMIREGIEVPTPVSPNSVPWSSLPVPAPQPVVPNQPAPLQPEPVLPAPVTNPPPVVNNPPPSEPPPTPITLQPFPIVKNPDPNRNLDIIFIVDTSASLNSERSRVASQMRSFVSHLDPSTDYHIGVVLAHAPATLPDGKLYPTKSPYCNKANPNSCKTTHPENLMGQLYVKNSQDAAVLDFSTFYLEEKTKGASDAQAQDRAKERVMSMLEDKMKNPADDHSPAEGELGLYNVYKIVTDPTLRGNLINQGLFRKGAVLEIFFISDEDDVCFDYQKLAPDVHPAYTAKNGKKPAPPIGRDPVEQWTFDNICNGAAGPGLQLEPDDVGAALDQLKADQGLYNIVVSGAVYVPTSKIPRCFADRGKRVNCPDSHKVDAYADEKEIGYGYTDLIRRFSDNAVDLSAPDFGTQLAELGDKTAVTLKYPKTFEFKIGDDAIDRVDPNSIQVQVEGAGGTAVTFSSGAGESSADYARIQKIHRDDGWYLLVTVEETRLGKILNDADGTARLSYSELKAGEKNHIPTENQESPLHLVKPAPQTPVQKAEAKPVKTPEKTPAPKQDAAKKKDALKKKQKKSAKKTDKTKTDAKKKTPSKDNSADNNEPLTAG